MRLPLAGLLLLAACAQQPTDPTLVTSDEDRQLNEAAASLEANTLATQPDGNDSQ